MAKYSKIPEATIRRLSNYLKCLGDLESKNEKVASSALIATICNVNAAQVRKDFAYFGEFGIRGMGLNLPHASASFLSTLFSHSHGQQTAAARATQPPITLARSHHYLAVRQ